MLWSIVVSASHTSLAYIALFVARAKLGRWPNPSGPDDPKGISAATHALQALWLYTGWAFFGAIAVGVFTTMYGIFRVRKSTVTTPRKPCLINTTILLWSVVWWIGFLAIVLVDGSTFGWMAD